MTPPSTCPHCGDRKPAKARFCPPCWQEIPWALKVQLWTAEGREYAARTAHCYSHEATLGELEHAQRAIATHLKLYSSAVA